MYFSSGSPRSPGPGRDSPPAAASVPAPVPGTTAAAAALLMADAGRLASPVCSSASSSDDFISRRCRSNMMLCRRF